MIVNELQPYRIQPYRYETDMGGTENTFNTEIDEIAPLSKNILVV